jgi:hypothetical protein
MSSNNVLILSAVDLTEKKQQMTSTRGRQKTESTSMHVFFVIFHEESDHE